MKSSKLDKAKNRARGVTEESGTAADETELDKRRKLAQEHVPQGYEDQSTDVVGFWKQDGPAIHFIPVEARLMDSSIDKTKSSTLLIGRLIDSCELVTGDGVVVDGQPGDVLGVWAKPGMSALACLCGVPVYMYLDSHKDVGKASPMAVFAVMSKGRGTMIPVARDTRLASRGVRDTLGLVAEVRTP